MGPALTGYKHREDGVVTISKLDEPNKVGEGKKEGWQSMMRVNFPILRSLRQSPSCLFVAMAVVSGKIKIKIHIIRVPNIRPYKTKQPFQEATIKINTLSRGV